MRCALTTLALVLALALAGCAGGARNVDSASDFKGEQQTVAQVIEDLQSAAEDSDERKICTDLITGGLRDAITSGGKAATCRGALEKALKDTDQSDLTVKRVTIDGDKATAVVRAKLSKDESRDETIELSKLGAAWRISTLP